jgi:hypothetical protein
MLILIYASLWVLELNQHSSPCGQIRTPLGTGYRPTPSRHAAPTGRRRLITEFTAMARFGYQPTSPRSKRVAAEACKRRDY